MKKIFIAVLLTLLTSSAGFSQFAKNWEKSKTAGNYPKYLSTSNLERGMAYGKVGGNDRIYLASRNNGSFVYIFNAATGDSVGTLITAGVSGGTYPLNDVEVSQDGQIFLGNLTTNVSTSPFKVYRYVTESDSPRAVINYSNAALGALRFGDKFTVTGSASDNSLRLWALSASSNKLVMFTTKDNGATFKDSVIALSNGNLAATPSLSPNYDNTKIYIKSNSLPVYSYDMTGKAIDTLSTDIVPIAANAIRYFETGGRKFIATYNWGTVGKETFRLVDITSGLKTGRLLYTSPSAGAAANSGGVGDLDLQKNSDGTFNIYYLASNNGLEAYKIGAALAGDYFIPQGTNPQGFANLTEGFFWANLGGLSGMVNFNIADSTVEKEGALSLKRKDMSAANTLTIRPVAGKHPMIDITAATNNNEGISFYDSKYLVVDGSNGDGQKDLTFRMNSNKIAYGLRITNDCQNMSLKNINVLLNFVPTGTVRGLRTEALASIAPKNISFENCTVGSDTLAFGDAVAISGGAENAMQTAITVKNCRIYTGYRGITTWYNKNNIFTGNHISCTSPLKDKSFYAGIYLVYCDSTMVSNNIIDKFTVNTASGKTAMGINVNGNLSGTIIANNMINMDYKNLGTSKLDQVYGIFENFPNDLQIYHNTILLPKDSVAAFHAVISLQDTTTKANLINNIFINQNTGATSYIYYNTNRRSINANYNDIVVDPTAIAGKFTDSTATVFSGLKKLGVDYSSVNVPVTFVSPTDLHVSDAMSNIAKLAGINSSYLTDIDGKVRDSYYPYMGANEAGVSLRPVGFTEVNNLKDLHNATDTKKVYHVKGDLLVTHTSTFQGKKFLQDSTAAIMVYDVKNIIGTAYKVGDKLKDIIGTISPYKGLLEFVPSRDPMYKVSTGNQVVPQDMSLAQFKAAFPDVQSKLVRITNVRFAEAQGKDTTFVNGKYLHLFSGKDSTTFRTEFYEADYSGKKVPKTPINLTGIALVFTPNNYMAARSSADMELIAQPDSLKSYWMASARANSFPYYLDKNNTSNGASYGYVDGRHRLYVATRSSNPQKIMVLCATSGAVMDSIPVPTDAVGTLPINRVAVSTDGKIFVNNVQAAVGKDSPFQIHMWDSEKSVPQLVVNYTDNIGRLGDSFLVTGKASDNSLTLLTSGDGSKLVKFSTTDKGKTFTPSVITLSGASTAVSSVQIDTNGTFYAKKIGGPLVHYTAQGSLLDTVKSDQIAPEGGAIRLLYKNNQKLLLLYRAQGFVEQESEIADVIDITNQPKVVARTASIGSNPNPEGTGSVDYFQKSDSAYVVLVFGTNNGVGAFSDRVLVPESVSNEKGIPTEYALNQNYPNPFNPSTVISFSLKSQSRVTLEVFNILGQKVATLLNGQMNMGSQQVTFNANRLATGVYVYRLNVQGADGAKFVSVKKMMLMK